MSGEEVPASPEMEAYFSLLEVEAEDCYQIAAKARSLGIDPSLDVEIPRAKDLAARVEKQLMDYNVEGVADIIRQLSEEYNREEVALLVAKDFASRPGATREEALERAVRIGLSVLTEGILVAPLEGIVEVKVESNPDGTEFASIFFAGPIRSAGGTGQAMSVLICDVVRRELGIDRYKPTHAEVERMKEEIPLYKQSQHLQYTPSPEEIELIGKSCPVCIDGEGTEDLEVSGYRNIPRIPSNRVRGGACLVLAEGMVQKAAKLMKHVNNLELDGWNFLDSLVHTSGPDDGKKDDKDCKPKAKYIKDMVAGRPILSHPSRMGGFRLRYGKARTTGLAATAISPVSMAVFQDMIAIGTQIKMEFPGKAGAITPCDELDGPFVILNNGDFLHLKTEEEAQKVKDRITKIIDIGEVLVPFGEFTENNHPLRPGAYAFERWVQEAERAGAKDPPEHPSAEEAFSLSDQYDIPLHPDHNMFWHDLSGEEVAKLSTFIEDKGTWKDGLLVPLEVTETLQTIGCTYKKEEEHLMVEHYAPALLRCLGLGHEGEKITRTMELTEEVSGCGTVTALSGITIMPKAPTRIGARMGRPEKAKERKMRPPVHSLFPVGNEVGSQRMIKDAAARGTINVELGIRECARCGKETTYSLCSCGGHTNQSPEHEMSYVNIPMREIVGKSLAVLGMGATPDAKGVTGLISAQKVPEPLEKGLLRCKHNVFVFKDGTIRFDLTDLTLTHFKPDEIALPVDKCREMGYTKDVYGKELERGDQVVELRVQDIVLSTNSGEYLVRAANFIDELLEKVYGMEPFYKVKEPGDLLGQLMVGLAPHTSGGVLCRLIGFSDATVGYGHPFFHAAKRRNCDGDEDCVMLLMDGLLNFSKQFLPRTRGGLMDAPLVLTTRIDPMEIDKEAHNIDVMFRYPLEFYELADKFTHPSKVDCVETVKNRIKTPAQYEGFGFTHDTKDIAQGVTISSYKTLGTMAEKMDAQLSLARKIRAVDESDTASRIIISHFLPDIIGNMKKFCAQKFRCTKCNTTYRRLPLAGKCTQPRKTGYFQGAHESSCGGNMVLTVYEKSVIKYLERSKNIAYEYDLSTYTKQRLELLEDSIDSLFNNGKVKSCSLEDFF